MFWGIMKHKLFLCRKFGFSMVELLISLIVISCITAAFAPLITKKFSSSVFGFGGGGGNTPSISSDCSSRFSSDCLLCTSSECLSCAKTCPDGQCQDSTNCTCKECPASEYPNCIKFTNSACIQCKNGYRLVDSTCIACPNGKYSDNGKECKYCEAGYWPNDDKTACVECPKGYICNQDTKVKCSGTTAPKIEENLGGVLGKSHICAPCPAGSYCVDGIETKCPEGTYSQGNKSQCSTCPDNEYPTEDQSTCTTCPTGYYCSGGQQVSCSEKWRNCAECDSTGCTKCKENFNFSNGQCESLSPVTMKIGNLYVTKYNMGDRDELPIPSTITLLNYNEKCPTNGRCCWQGQTANGSYCDAQNGGYSGCKRTVCNWDAAREVCARFNLDGFNWRLPAYSEMSSWYSYSALMSANGLQLCSYTSSNSKNWSRCYAQGNCGNYVNSSYVGTSQCYPSYLWTRNSYNSLNAYYYHLDGSSWNYSYTYNRYPASVRCVAQESNTCPAGTYKSNNDCLDCSNKYPNCSLCDDQLCHLCQSGYEFHRGTGKCVKSLENALPVDNFYVTKYNMGDNGLPIPSTVTILPINGTCTSIKCCWQGRTANSSYCDAFYNGYSGCNRTVCNFEAAKEICSQYTAGNKTWRLPKYSEMKNWYQTYSANYADIYGLQLCSYTSSTSYNWPRCYSQYGCKGTYSDNCYPSYIWTQNTYNINSAYYYYLDSSSWNYSYTYNLEALSVRCITDRVD